MHATGVADAIRLEFCLFILRRMVRLAGYRPPGRGVPRGSLWESCSHEAGAPVLGGYLPHPEAMSLLLQPMVNMVEGVIEQPIKTVFQVSLGTDILANPEPLTTTTVPDGPRTMQFPPTKKPLPPLLLA